MNTFQGESDRILRGPGHACSYNPWLPIKKGATEDVRYREDTETPKQEEIKMWNQVYDPLGSAVWSTLAAGIPVAVLLCSLAFFHM
jgi:hypothetical protein